MPDRTKAGAWLVVARYGRLAVGLCLLVVLFRFVPVAAVLKQLGAARPGPMALVVVTSFAALAVSALKLWVLMRASAGHVSLPGVLRAYYVGTFFNNFMPTGVGGDVFKVNELRLRGVLVPHGAAAVVMERATGVAAMLALALAVAAAWPALLGRLGMSGLRWPLAGVCAAVLAAMAGVVAWWRWRPGRPVPRPRDGPVRRALAAVMDALQVFGGRPALLGLALGLSAVFYAIVALNLVIAGRALSVAVPALPAAGIVPLTRIPEVLPISLGSLGVREGALTYCLSRIGPTAAEGAAIALLLRALNLVHSLVGGCLYALGGRAAARREEGAG